MLGGMASHAAVVARSWGIPAVTSLQETNLTEDGFMLQSGLVPEGTTITVDGSRGEIFLGDLPTTVNEIPPELQTLLGWKTTEGASSSSEIELFELAASAESIVAVLKIVKLKGMCTSDQISQALLVSDKNSAKVISNCGELLEKVGDYYSLSDVGRELLLTDLGEKQALIPIADLEQLHQQFLELDSELKSLVTGWQLTQEKDESDLKELHSRLEIITTNIGTDLIQLENIDRTFRRYVPLFEIALDGIKDGNTSMIASPLKDSYHTLWFELHQELIDLSGMSRADIEK
jgi:pyruvate,orthophosphate dikinase